MPIIPTGNPAWTRSSAHTTYGGDLNKRNHLSQGVVDPETDLGAEQLTRMTEDLAAIARVSPFSVITYTNNDGSPAAPTISTVLQMNGTNTGPTVKVPASILRRTSPIGFHAVCAASSSFSMYKPRHREGISGER